MNKHTKPDETIITVDIKCISLSIYITIKYFEKIVVMYIYI